MFNEILAPGDNDGTNSSCGALVQIFVSLQEGSMFDSKQVGINKNI